MLNKLLTIPGLASLPPEPAPAQDSALVRLLRTNAYPLTAAGSQLAGPGWDKRRAGIAKSPFVLVGADHGLVPILPFTRAVAREQHPAAFITEIDRCPFSHPMRLPATPGFLSFFSRGEECELAPPSPTSLSTPGYFTAYVTAR